jgi:CheY-like chemotaxis protein
MCPSEAGVEGYNVVAVAEGHGALDYMRGAAPPPCMTLLDLMMAGMNGWEFRAEQLRDSRLSPIPVIVSSGDGRVIERPSHWASLSTWRSP